MAGITLCVAERGVDRDQRCAGRSFSRMIAEFACEALRSLVYRTAWLVDTGQGRIVRLLLSPGVDFEAVPSGGPAPLSVAFTDVVGLKVSEGLLGQRDLEVATIEAKLTRKSWKQVFFEAVSHKRFSHRAYFAFGASPGGALSLVAAPNKPTSSCTVATASTSH
mgnify:CR=1 FL=1